MKSLNTNKRDYKIKKGDCNTASYLESFITLSFRELVRIEKTHQIRGFRTMLIL